MDESFGFGEMGGIPSELHGPLPRRVRLTGNGIALAVMTTIFLVGGVTSAVWLGWKGEQVVEHRKALRSDGIEVQGQVTRVWSSGKSSNTHHVSYSFEVNGSAYSGESYVPTVQWRTLWAARPITIRYLPANPNVNHPADWEESDASAWLPLMLPVLLSVMAILFIYQLRLDRQLILGGLPAIATVTGCTRRKNGYSIRFEFRTQTGTEARGGGWSATFRSEGERVCILYLPENPRRSQPYPLQSYRAAA